MTGELVVTSPDLLGRFTELIEKQLKSQAKIRGISEVCACSIPPRISGLTLLLTATGFSWMQSLNRDVFPEGQYSLWYPPAHGHTLYLLPTHVIMTAVSMVHIWTGVQLQINMVAVTCGFSMHMQTEHRD